MKKTIIESWYADLFLYQTYRMLNRFGWRDRVKEVAEKIPAFGPLVEVWPKMEELWNEEAPSGNCPKLYEFMKALRSRPVEV